MKLARQYFMERGEPQRTRFIARRQSYHGNTLGSLATGMHMGRRAVYEAILSQNVSHVSPCYPYRDQKDGESDEAYVRRLAEELEAEFQAVGPGNACAFISETISGTVCRLVYFTVIPLAWGRLCANVKACLRHWAARLLSQDISKQSGKSVTATGRF